MKRMQRFALAGIGMMIVPLFVLAVLAFLSPDLLSMPVVWILVGSILIGLVLGMGSIPELVYRWAQRTFDKQ